MEPNFWNMLLICMAAAWIARPVHVAVHEFSHALAALCLTHEPLRVRLGEQIDGLWRKGRLEIGFQLTRWRAGTFHYVSRKYPAKTQALILVAGPIGTTLLTLTCTQLLVAVSSPLLQIACIPFVAYGAKFIILSLYPRVIHDTKTGESIRTDGYRITRIPWGQPASMSQ